jgi:hypothetical protein
MPHQCKRVFQLCPIIGQLGIAITDPSVAETSSASLNFSTTSSSYLSKRQARSSKPFRTTATSLAVYAAQRLAIGIEVCSLLPGRH